jgi:hypothetical protein
MNTRLTLALAVSILFLGFKPLRAIIWTEEVVDSIPASALSLVVDGNDSPHIAYNGMAHEIMYARRDGASWQIEVVDPSGGHDPSLALDRYDVPHLIYNDETDSIIRYATRSGGSWSIETVDTLGTLTNNRYILDLDSRGFPHAVYNAAAVSPEFRELKYAFFDGVSWKISTIDTPGNDRVEDPSLALDDLDMPHIVYCHQIAGNIMDQEILYTTWDDGGWTRERIDGSGWTVSNCGNLSVRLDDTGRPHVSYFVGIYYPEERYRNYIRYATRNGLNWSVETLDLEADFSHDVGLAVDRWDGPHLIYRREAQRPLEPPEQLAWARNDGSGWSTQVLDDVDAQVPMIALDGRDDIHIVYRDGNRLIYRKGIPEVSLMIVPDRVTVPPGDSLVFTATFVNNRGAAIAGEAWIELEIPSGNSLLLPEAILNQPNPGPIALTPSETLAVEYVVEVPPAAPTGDYRVIGNVGLFAPGFLVDRDFFDVSVVELTRFREEVTFGGKGVRDD